MQKLNDLFVDDMSLYVENPKGYTYTHTKKRIKLLNEFCRVAGY